MTTEFYFYYETRGEANHYRPQIANVLGHPFSFWIEPRDSEWLLKFTIPNELTRAELEQLVPQLRNIPGYDGWGQPVEETDSEGYSSD